MKTISYPVLNHLIHGLGGESRKGGFVDMKLNFLNPDLGVEVLLQPLDKCIAGDGII